MEEKFDVTTATTTPVTTVTTALATEPTPPDVDGSGGEYEGSGQHDDVTSDDVIIRPAPMINDVVVDKLEDEDLILIH